MSSQDGTLLRISKEFSFFLHEFWCFHVFPCLMEHFVNNDVQINGRNIFLQHFVTMD